MRKLAPALALALALAATAGSARADTFAVVAAAAPPALPSAEVPNADGSIVLPPAFTTPSPHAYSQLLTFPELQALWERAGAAYGIPWHVLAAINKIESNFGRNMGPSSAGAVGWMQFMPSTWLRWGMDATGDGIADPWNAEDAVFAAARYLAAAGGRTDLPRAIFAYNHADWYVRDVLELAAAYGIAGVDATVALDRMQQDLEASQLAVAETNEALAAAAALDQRLARAEQRLLARVDGAALLSERLAFQQRAVQLGARRDEARAEIARLQRELERAETALASARSGAVGAAFMPAGAGLLGSPTYAGDYVFPVGGGAATVSVARTHHDYPAADIAAPAGAPLYALADGIVRGAWHVPSGRCGIGFTVETGDGLAWTYCHLAYLEPGVQSGAVLSAGAPVGLVGSTGTTSTGPHLHLQLAPPTSYPQEQAWFQAFAGTAFRWEGEATSAAVVPSRPIFAAVPSAPEDAEVIAFTR
jgi:murein DD-endopeptidase MepM/ murein hydrolase activator NlpD